MTTTQDLQAVMVYGSARPGEYNYWFEEAVLEVIPNVTTHGRMTHNGAYPYMSYHPQVPEVIRGDLLIMDTTHQLFRMFEDMELGAGYDREDIPVHSVRHGLTIGAVAYTIPCNDRRMSLPAVPDGDWPRFRRQHLR